MSTTEAVDRQSSADRQGLSRGAWFAIALGIAAVVYAALESSRGVEGTRLERPAGAFQPERKEFLGTADWYILFEIGSLVAFFAVWVSRSGSHGDVASRRRP